MSKKPIDLLGQLVRALESYMAAMGDGELALMEAQVRAAPVIAPISAPAQSGRQLAAKCLILGELGQRLKDRAGG